MLRLVLLLILFIVIARIFWRVVDNVIAAASGQPPGNPRTPQHGVAMVRDPVCGTFVLPDRSVFLLEHGARVYFCSDRCREKYRAGPRNSDGRHAQGRTA